MLKLTQTDTKTAIHVSAHGLVHNGAIWELEHIGSGIQIGGREFWVTETPEQILAMPEMQYALYPPMVVGTNSPDHTMGFNPGWPHTSRTFGTSNNGPHSCISQHCPNWKGN
jgi:hypothetical protein